MALSKRRRGSRYGLRRLAGGQERRHRPAATVDGRGGGGSWVTDRHEDRGGPRLSRDTPAGRSCRGWTGFPPFFLFFWWGGGGRGRQDWERHLERTRKTRGFRSSRPGSFGSVLFPQKARGGKDLYGRLKTCAQALPFAAVGNDLGSHTVRAAGGSAGSPKGLWHAGATSARQGSALVGFSEERPNERLSLTGLGSYEGCVSRWSLPAVARTLPRVGGEGVSGQGLPGRPGCVRGRND